MSKIVTLELNIFTISYFYIVCTILFDNDLLLDNVDCSSLEIHINNA